MKFALLTLTLSLAGIALSAQDTKPVPKGSERVAIPGCVKGRILTAIPPSEAQPGTLGIPEGTHLRMNGPGKLLKEIEAHKGTVVVVTGLMKTGQQRPEGISLGGNVNVTGAGPFSRGAAPVQNQAYIDVEGWRQGFGDCPR